MAELAGKDLLLQIDTGGGSYSTLGGLQAKEYTITNEEIDVTNHGSNQWKTVLDGAGVRSMSISGSGVHNDGATLDQAEDACKNGTLTNFRIDDSAGGGRTYTGSFKVTEFGRSAEHNGAQEFSISLVSAGEITIA
jgi:TP901-1 family phage major tail protein